MKRYFLLLISLLLLLSAGAQRFDYHNLNVQIGHKGYISDFGDLSLSYVYDTLSSKTIRSNGRFAPELNYLTLETGFEFQVEDEWLVSVKGDFHLNGIKGYSLMAGAAYRYRLNYFMRLQPELLLTYNYVSDTIGGVSRSEDTLVFSDGGFFNETPIIGFYRNSGMAMQPRLSFIADVNDFLEFRFTAIQQISFLNSEQWYLEGEVISGQKTSAEVPFSSERFSYTLEDMPPEKALIRMQGFSFRAGFALKF